MRDLSKLVDRLGGLTLDEAAQLRKMLDTRWASRQKTKPRLNFNEGKVCDAVVRRLEEREQSLRTNIRSPELQGHKFPVELAFNLRTQLFALEHTGIEPFDGHMELEAQTEKLFAPIKEGLKDSLGTEALFELYLPVHALRGRKPKELSEIQKTIIEWVKATAPTIPKRPWPDRRGERIGPVKVAGVPFDLVLIRFEPPSVPGRHFEMRHTVENLEKQRSDRIQAAIDKKFPKLASWKTNENARTVLVLEENDIQLTNPALVADAFLPLAKERSDTPDETYLVASFPNENWWMWPILVDGRSYYDFAESDETSYWEFDPKVLLQLTSR
jgi:hypothetical protein